MDLSVTVFRFKRNSGGNTTVTFMNGRRKSVLGGQTVDIPAEERTLLKRVDPSTNPLSEFVLLGAGSTEEVKSQNNAAEALKKLSKEPDLKKSADAKMRMVEVTPGWYDVFNGNDEKVNTTKLRKSQAEELVKGSTPDPIQDAWRGPA